MPSKALCNTRSDYKIEEVREESIVYHLSKPKSKWQSWAETAVQGEREKNLQVGNTESLGWDGGLWPTGQIRKHLPSTLKNCQLETVGKDPFQRN